MRILNHIFNQDKRDLNPKDQEGKGPIKGGERLVMNGVATIGMVKKRDHLSALSMVGISILLFGLSGCVSLLPKASNPPKEVTLSFLDRPPAFQGLRQDKDLNDKSLSSQRKRSQNLVLKIDKVTAAAPLQTQRILLIIEELFSGQLDASGQVDGESQKTGSDQTRKEERKNITLASDYLADVIWNEPLVDLVRSRLVAELREEGVFKGVGQAHEPFKADFLYLPALHHFEIKKALDGSYMAVVSLSLREVAYHNRALKREKTFTNERQVSPSLQDFIAGLDQAFLFVLEKAVAWVETPIK